MRYFGGGIGHQKIGECLLAVDHSSDSGDEDREDDAMDVDRTTPIVHAGNMCGDHMDTDTDSELSSDWDTDTDTDSENSYRYCDFGPEDDDRFGSYDALS